MAKNNNDDISLSLGINVDEQQIKKELDKVKKIVAKNGYIELDPKIASYKYPSRSKAELRNGSGMDYTKLQKAQDELISKWDKLSKKGFSSREDSVINAVKAYRNYNKTVKEHYKGKLSLELEDKQVNAIRTTIGAQINKNLSRLLQRVVINDKGKTGTLTDVESDKMLEKYTKEALKRNKAAKKLGFNLSQDDAFTKNELQKIIDEKTKLEKKAAIKKRIEEKRYETEHAKEIENEQKEQVKKIEKARAEQSKRAIKLAKGKIDNVRLTRTKVESLKQGNYKADYSDYRSDQTFLNNLSRGTNRSKGSAAGGPIALGTREQSWDPTYISEDFLRKMERGGTYVDTNALLRQTAQALPEEIKKAVKSLKLKIDKDEAAKVFNTFNKSDRKQFSDLANQTGMSSLMLTNVAKVQGALMAGREDVTGKDLKDAIIVALNDALLHGKSAILAENYKSAISGITNMLMNRYSNQKDAIGSTIGRRKKRSDGTYYDEKERGVGPNYNAVKKVLKDVFKDFEKTSQVLMARAVKEYPEFYNVDGEKTKQGNTFSKEYIEQLATAAESLKGILGDAAGDVAALLRLSTTELVDGAKDTQLLDKSVKAEESIDDTTKIDANDGYNKEENAQKSIEAQTSTNTVLDQLLSLGDDRLQEITKTLQAITKIISYTEKNKPRNIEQTVSQLPLGLPIPKSHFFWKPEEASKRDARMSYLQKRRLSKFGMTDEETGTGDVIKIGRRKVLFGREKNPFIGLQLAKGLGEIDVDAITNALQKSIEGHMFEAQTGGWKSALAMAMTGGLSTAFTPSLEKSRARTEGANQIMANVRDIMQDLLQNIASKQSALSRFEREGQIKFNDYGTIIEDTSEGGIASTLAAQMEDSNEALRMALADMVAFNDELEKSGGNANRMFTRFEFLSPVLRGQNKIIQNINKGLDKSGKALKAQTRLAEILNYTFQLMGRHVGQTLKSWLLQLNPITQIKKLFTDFTGYSVKWQRTMNVIKYNLRAIVRPFMERIAQALVNAIGFLDIISMKIQEAFGNTPISVFDQAAADSEKIHEELEAATNVTAGFDELHDIGSDNSGANNLLGEIYKPQLSEEWKKLAEDIGDLFKGLITGDLGLGEALVKAGELLKRFFDLVFTAIGKFLDQKVWPLIKDKWHEILWGIIGLVTLWEVGKLLIAALLKGIGKAILSGGASILGKIGTGLVKLLGLSTFGEQMKIGFMQAFQGQGLIGAIKGGGATLGSVFAQSFLAVAGIAIAALGISHFGNEADKNSAYNYGLMEMGGKEEDKKSNFWNGVGATLTGAAGGALTGFAIGGPLGAAIGAAIGGIAGIIRTVLSPVIEEAEIKARNMNNEMQKIEYYEGAVKGAQSQVDILDELMGVLNQTLQEQTDKVYKQGTELGISKTRMDELVKSTQDGTFETSMLTGAEIALSDSLTGLMTTQGKVDEATKRLTDAKKKLLKAETELAIAQDMEAGNYELAAARIELAEAQEVYSTEEATKKRIQLFKTAGEEERKNLLQNFSAEQRTRMAELNDVTDSELQSLLKIWQESGEDIRDAFLSGTDASVQAQFQRQMNDIDSVVKSHQNFWQGVGDTLAEIFTFGNAKTWTYNGKEKYAMEYQNGKYKIQTYDIGTNYVPSDGLAYLHQGEAVIPKKYNQPYQQSMSIEEQAYMAQMMATMQSLNDTMKQGIAVNGQFTQRGSDLVAVVNKTNSQIGADLLSNVSYAR